MVKDDVIYAISDGHKLLEKRVEKLINVNYFLKIIILGRNTI